MAKQWILSDESKNSYGFVVRTAGISLVDFLLNPVMLLNHDFNKVMGAWLDPEVKGVQLIATDDFDTEDPEAMLISGKVDRKYIKGCSIGIKILKVAKEMINGEMTPVVTSCILKEASVTPLPSNKNAVRIYDENDKLLSEQDMLAYLSSKSTLTIPNLKTKTMKNLRDKLIALFAMFKLNVTLSDAEDEDTMASEVVAGIKKALELKDGEIKTLNDKVKDFEQKRVDKLMADSLALKKFTKADEQKWRDRALKDYDATEDVLGAIAGVGKLNDQLSKEKETPGAGADKGNGKSGDDRSNWDLYDWSKKDEAGLLKMKKSNPEAYKKLFDACMTEAEELTAADKE